MLKGRDVPEVIGSKAEWVPFGSEFDPRTVRNQKNFDAKKRVPYLHEIPIHSLPRFEHVRAVIEHFVVEQNRTETRGLRGNYPLSKYLRDAPEPSPEPSRLIEAFPVHRVQLGTTGIEIHDRMYQSGKLHESYPLRTKLFVRADPLERGMYVFPLSQALRARTRGLFVGDQHSWAKTLEPAEMAKKIRAEFKQLREEVNADRDAFVEETIGREAMEDLAEAKQDWERSRRKTSRTARRIEKAKAVQEQSDLFAPTTKSNGNARAAADAPSGMAAPHTKEAATDPASEPRPAPRPNSQPVARIGFRRKPMIGARVRLIDNSLNPRPLP